MTCDQVHLDGAYVLGALAPAERQEFERHLAGCEECRRSVGELAGLPGLLAQASADDLERTEDPPVPPTLVPAAVRDVRRAERRRSVVVAAAAAAVAVIGVGGLAVGGALDGAERTLGAGPTTTTTSPAPRVSATPMDAVGSSPVAGEVALASVSWGTRLDVTCSYEDAQEQYEAAPDATYALVVRTRDGRTEQVATWHGLPGRTMHLSAATATRRDEITTVEMRTAGGLVVLRLPV